MTMMSLQQQQQELQQLEPFPFPEDATAAIRAVPSTAVFPSQFLMELNQQGLEALSSHDFDEAIQLIRQGLTLLQSYCRIQNVNGSTMVPNLTLAPAELALFPLHQNKGSSFADPSAADRSTDHNMLALSPTVFCVNYAPTSSSLRLDVLSAAVLYNLAYACQTKALVLRALSATPTYDPCTQQLLLSHQELQHEFQRAEKLYDMAAAAAQRAWQQQPSTQLTRLMLPICNNRAHMALQLLNTPLAQQCLDDLQAFMGQLNHHHQEPLVGINEMMLNILQWNGLRSAPAA